MRPPTVMLSKCQVPLHGPDPTRHSLRACRRPGSLTRSGRARLVEFGLNQGHQLTTCDLTLYLKIALRVYTTRQVDQQFVTVIVKLCLKHDSVALLH